MHHTDPCPLPRAAFQAIERGWRIFPLVPDGKRPAIRSWEERAAIDPVQVGRCWAAGDYNIGLATGPSLLVVIDLDVPKHDQDLPPAGTPANVLDGADMLALLAEQHGERYPTDTYTVRTVSGGTHLYFSAPEHVGLRNTAGTLGWKIDTRANGGYVVGAGSRIGGNQYTVVHSAAPAPLPEWIKQLLTPAPLPPQGPVVVPLEAEDRHGAYLRAAVDGELQRISRAGTGNRNNALYQSAVALGQLIAGGELDSVDVTERLVAAACRVGLAELDARRTVASGLRAGSKRPRTVLGRRAA